MALVMGEIPRQRDFLRNAHSVLKPEGRLSITELFPDPHFLSQEAVRTIVEEAGFWHEKTEGSRCFYTATFRRQARDLTGLDAEGVDEGA